MVDKDQRPFIDDEDDGHVIADMNVEGMPWYRKKQPWERGSGSGNNDLDAKSTWWVILGTLKAAFLIGGVFILAFLVVIVLICMHVWF